MDNVCQGCRWAKVLCDRCPVKHPISKGLENTTPKPKLDSNDTKAIAEGIIFNRKCEARVSKYRNKKTEVDGILFDSGREAKRYQELKLMEKAGEITGLELQPEFALVVNDKLICKYRADFRYWKADRIDKPVIEDSKGMCTKDYRIKKKLFEALFDTELVEV